MTQLERKISTLQREVQEKTEEIELTKRKLDQYKDYDTVKNELEVLKVSPTHHNTLMLPQICRNPNTLQILTSFVVSVVQYIEFSGSRGDADDDWDDRVLTLASKNLEKPIEVLLMEKNRKLENELTELKVQHEAVSQEYETLKTRHEVSDRQLNSQMELIQRLEEDITRLNQSGGAVNGYHTQGVGNGYFAPGSNGPSTGHQHPTSPPFGQLAFSGEVVGGVTLGPVLPNTPRAPGFPSSASLSLDASTPAATTSSAEHSILPIVTSQRDRFRQRNSELEEQLRQQSEQISNLRNETRTLQQDNVKLYEKMKYMQSYRGGDDSSGSGVGAGYFGSAAPSAMVDFSSPFRSSGMTGRPTGGQHKKSDGDEIQMQGVDPTDRYRNMYEESMNPFEAFHKKVKSICSASVFNFSIRSSCSIF